MNNSYGIILDGEVAVGRFVFITEEDKSGQRQIMKLDINPTYVDVCSGKTKSLRCLLVEQSSEDNKQNETSEIKNPISVKILKDLGVGNFEGKVVFDEKQAHYQKAVFNKTPEKLNKKFN